MRKPVRLALALLGAAHAAAAQESAPVLALHELIPNATFADGASGWRLDHARALPDLGPDGQPVLELTGALSGPSCWAYANVSVPGVPPGTDVTLSARVQSLKPTQVLWFGIHPLALDDSGGWKDLDDTQQYVQPPLGQWTDVSIRFVVPEGCDLLQVRISSKSERPALVTDVHLRPTQAGAPDAAEALAGLPAGELERRVREAFAVAARLRHITDGMPALARLVDRAAMARTVDMQYRGEALAEIAREQVALRQLGIWPADVDDAELQRRMTTGSVSGMYFPPAHVILIAADMPEEILDMVLVHESVHAIDSRMYGLWGSEAARLSGDDSTAFSATVEGSAVLVQLVDTRSRGAPAVDRLDGAADVGLRRILTADGVPPLFARRSVAPYFLGVHFLTRGAGLAADGSVPLDDVGRALARPPVSTEQILHPAKYWNEAERDEPRSVVLSDLSARLGEGWTLAAHGTLGELDLTAMTDLPLPADAKISAASADAWISPVTAGWGGDTWQSYQRGADSITILATLWDSAVEAEEFARGVRRPAGAALRQRDDAVVIVVDGRADGRADAAEALAETVLDALKAR